ncbi:MAG: hypothetical protein IJI26_10950 [Clostridia bacterium]|nr:hypothetical protein [Clostridia bacterium]
MKRILIYGDSNSWGFDVTRYIPEIDTYQRMTEEERWPSLVRTLLGSGYEVIEDALNGRTTLQEDPYMPHRNGLTGLCVALDANAPLDLVVIQLGCNELKQMFNLSAGMIARGVERLVQECEQPLYGYAAPKVLLIAPAPTHPDIGKLAFGYNFGPEAYQKSLEFGAHYRAVAERHGCGFIDCAALGFEINNIDGLHYSKADHARLAPVVADAIRGMLAP